MKEHALGDPIIPLSVSFEERLTRFENDAEADEECKKLGTKSALPKIITTMRQTLNLGSFFTTGADEVRQWTIRKGTKAPQAAGVIHGDFEKTFIQAIVYNYDVLKEYGNEADVKAAGKVLTKGKDYEMVSYSVFPSYDYLKGQLLTYLGIRSKTATFFLSKLELQRPNHLDA